MIVNRATAMAAGLITIERPGEPDVRLAWQLLPRELRADVANLARTREQHRDVMMRIGAALLQIKRQVEHGAYLHTVDSLGLHRWTAERAVKKLLEAAEKDGAAAVAAWISRERLMWCLGEEVVRAEGRGVSDEKRAHPLPPPSGRGSMRTEAEQVCCNLQHMGKTEPEQGCCNLQHMAKAGTGQDEALARRLAAHQAERQRKVAKVHGASRKGAGAGVTVVGGAGDVPGQMSLAGLYEAAERLRRLAERVVAGQLSAGAMAALMRAVDLAEGGGGGVGVVGGGGTNLTETARSNGR